MCGMVYALGSEKYDDSDSNLSARLRASLHRYSIDNGLLCYRTDVEDTARIFVAHDENLNIESSLRPTIPPSVGIWAGKRPMAL